MLTIFIHQTESVASHMVFVYDKPRKNRLASADICTVGF